jgi:hypothetical protein
MIWSPPTVKAWKGRQVRRIGHFLAVKVAWSNVDIFYFGVMLRTTSAYSHQSVIAGSQDQRHSEMPVQWNQNDTIFLFSLLRITGLYTFRALLAHPQEVLDKQHFVYCMHVSWQHQLILVQPTAITHMQYTNCCLCITSWGWASNAQNI